MVYKINNFLIDFPGLGSSFSKFATETYMFSTSDNEL